MFRLRDQRNCLNLRRTFKEHFCFVVLMLPFSKCWRVFFFVCLFFVKLTPGEVERLVEIPSKFTPSRSLLSGQDSTALVPGNLVSLIPNSTQWSAMVVLLVPVTLRRRRQEEQKTPSLNLRFNALPLNADAGLNRSSRDATGWTCAWRSRLIAAL